MTFGTLVFTAFTRNPLRSVFTFAAIASAFCLYGALETNLYERGVPAADADTIVVQMDGSTMLPSNSESAIAAMKGVQSVVGIQGLPAQNPKTPTQMLFVIALNPLAARRTFPGMEISKGVADRWNERPDGAIVDDKTAQDMGWHVND